LTMATGVGCVSNGVEGLTRIAVEELTTLWRACHVVRNGRRSTPGRCGSSRVVRQALRRPTGIDMIFLAPPRERSLG
jgi:hypothetical protein